MSQNSSFIYQPPKKANGRGNRNGSPKSKQQQDKESSLNTSYDTRLISHDDDKILSQSDTSFLHQLNDDLKSQKKPATISQKSSDDEQLSPDNPNKNQQSVWVQDKEEDQGKQKQKEKQSQKPQPHSRGNRGNRKDSKQEESSLKGSNTRNINPDHQLPGESTGPKKRGNRITSAAQSQKGFGGYNERSNYRNDQDVEYTRGFDSNRDFGRGRGGYRGGNRGSYRGSNNYRGGYNRNYGSEREQFSNHNNDKNYATDVSEGANNESTYKPDFHKKPRYYEEKATSNRWNNQYSGGFRANRQPEVVEKIVQKIVEKVVEKQVVKQVEPPRPTGIRVQPQVSMFIKGCKLTLTCRKLEDFKADLLIIPYKTPKLQLFPGYFVNSCEVNYKQKIKQKAAKMAQDGKLVYMQKCIGKIKFKAFAFLNVADAETNVKLGIKEVFENIKMITNSQKQKDMKMFDSIVFPISSQLDQSKTVINTLVKEIEEYSSLVRDMYILAEDYKVFCEAVTKFNEIFLELFEENELC